MKIFLQSIGCRLNQAEIDTMARQLLALGHDIVSDPSGADKVIINSCAVTGQAAKDTRARIRRVRRANEAAELYVTGCYATIASSELTKIDNKSLIISNQEKDQLVKIIHGHSEVGQSFFDKEPILRDYPISGLGKTRAFVKAQDGCDNRCTFCITTIARGDGRSRPTEDVLAQIQNLADSGCKEAVITGVHLGSYGHDLSDQTDLGELIRLVLHHTDIQRLRISSLEPWDIPTRFFDLWNNSRLLPHLHVPLQSGSDTILRRMARRTSRASFSHLATEARAAIPNLGLTTDIIVGFPGETEGHFQESLDFVNEMKFTRLHVFPYSQRPGTAASRMTGQVAEAVKKERVGRMIELGRRLSLSYHRSNSGRTFDVLWEAKNQQVNGEITWSGYSNNYIRIKAQTQEDLLNRVTAALLHDPTPSGMKGTVIN